MLWTFPPKPMRMSIKDLAGFNPKEWFAQIKYDGHHALPLQERGQTKVLSRHKKPLKVSDSLMSHIAGLGLPDDTMLDAEWTSRREKHKTEELYLFDVLWWGGKWVGDKPFEERYKLLTQIILPPSIIIVKNIQEPDSSDEWDEDDERERGEGQTN